MNPATGLEGRYRRLLAMYPAEHRRKHQDEMLGVLMTGARAGQRWPRLADSVNLIAGALRIRLRLPHGEGVRQGWADALAMTSVMVPILVLVYLVAQNLQTLTILPRGTTLFTLALASYSETAAAWLILTAVVLLRLRRIAAVAATGLLVWFAVSFSGATNWDYADPRSMIVFVALGLEVVALVASPGPRRGMQLMTWKHCAFAVAVPALIGPLSLWVWPSHPAVPEAVPVAVIAIIIAGMMLSTPLNKRLGILLSIPAYYVVIGFLVLPRVENSPYGSMAVWDGPLRITLTVFPFAVLLYVALRVALSSARRASAGGRAA